VPRFIFCVCQHGSEAALKQEVARQHPGLRFAFSRPNFVTFRLPDDDAGAAPFDLDCAFARTWGYSLGRIEADDPASLAELVWPAVAERLDAAELRRASHLHVWPRDEATPGDFGFLPGPTPESRAVGERILGHRPAAATGHPPRLNEHAVAGDTVLDCVLVAPGEWWLGWHRAARNETRWPGGVPQIAVPSDLISRAYLKITEALLWSELPLAAGDRCVEIGSAPGGACQALLERGCRVTGVDPAEMDARVLAHPRFTHVRARAKDLKRAFYAEFRWLLADANVAPNYTLDTVEAIVTNPRTQIAGLLLTLKLTKPDLVEALPSYCERMRSWGYETVRARQLAFNRAEVCILARRATAAPL
jgi:23S rRNA (cytidine2498-2'-O)-methyltransferase